MPAVFDGVGKKFHESLECLSTEHDDKFEVNGPLDLVNVPKIQPKGLYLTKPSIGQYFSNRKELQAGADQILRRLNLENKVEFRKIYLQMLKMHTQI